MTTQEAVHQIGHDLEKRVLQGQTEVGMAEANTKLLTLILHELEVIRNTLTDRSAGH